ncbi:MAG: polysaccharide deacetylase family protein, partial [Clostridia bacterium]
MIFRIKRRNVIFMLVCVLLLCTLPFFFHSASSDVAAVSNTNWGLSFRTRGAPPVGNAAADYLAKFGAYYIGDTAKKDVYLTFDAGYENGYTPKILDVLKKHNVHATFFLVGNYIDTSPELVKRMVREGHTVGNHTNTHPDMSKIANIDAFKKEICALEGKYQKVIGSPMPKFYRPPQGKFSESNLAHAKELGYKTVFWSLAYVDWYVDNQPTAQQAFDKLLPRMHDGAVVLLHSTSKTNADILDELLTKWEAAGYVIKP